LALTGNIASTDDVEAAVDATIERFGKIDILVHCAGIRGAVGVPVVDGDEAEWRNTLEINTLGVFIISKAVARHMIAAQKGGKIVHVASVAGRVDAPGSAAYAASKWATIGLVQSLAKELAPHKINVNAINPGFFATNLRDAEATAQAESKGVSVDEFKAEEYAGLAKLVPLGRMGTMDDISNLITFLVSSQSDYMTGQDLNITGGFLMP
jgi:NAD(P)-dependent dehydrogenase (short-subunit alcohol dehydrogenase family)